MQPRVSVVIPTYQRAGRLPHLIAALERQTLPIGDFEVVICDDGSTDETAGVLETLVSRSRLNLTVVRTDQNRGPAAARNLACRSARAPVLAFTDDDCAPTPGWLEAGLSCFGDDVGIVQGRTTPDPATPVGRWPATVQIDRFSKRYETCNIFWRADVLRMVGGFDESIYFFGEDTVPGWLARRRGVRERFAPDALVYHAVTYPGMRWHIRYAMQHGNWAALVRRFPEMRDEVLWLRLFLKRRHAALLGAIAGIALARTWRPAVALAVPYVWVNAPRALRYHPLVDFIGGAAFDALVVASLIRGSFRERTPVL